MWRDNSDIVSELKEMTKAIQILPLCAITIASNCPRGFPFSLKYHIPLNGSSLLIQVGLSTLIRELCTE